MAWSEIDDLTIANIRLTLDWLQMQADSLRTELQAKAYPPNRDYNPLQPRVPPGHGRLSGRWTNDDGSSAPALTPSMKPRYADIISVCIIDGGNSTSYDEFGNMRYRADYLCPGGQRFSRSGLGRAPGLVRDPFR